LQPGCLAFLCGDLPCDLCLESASSATLLLESLKRIESMENADFLGEMNDAGAAAELADSAAVSAEFIKFLAYDIIAFI
jgi:hypothetical protein